MEAQFWQGDPTMVNYTPEADIDAGEVVITNDTCRIAHRDIKAGELGALAAGGGIYKMTCMDAAGIGEDTIVGFDDVTRRVTAEITAAARPLGVTVSAASGAGQEILVRHDPAVLLG
jgi:predicted RecA/RadA family phage recombinase